MDESTTFIVIVEAQNPVSPAPPANERPRIVGFDHVPLPVLMAREPPLVEQVPRPLRPPANRRTPPRFVPMPFRGFRPLALGGHSTVLHIARGIVFKAPLYHDYSRGIPPPRVEVTIQRAGERLRREQTIFTILKDRRHPNLLAPLFAVAEGHFLPRYRRCLLDLTEFDRRINHDLLPEKLDLKVRWVRQIASALAWLEKQGFVHGCLDAAHIMLDKRHNAKIIDFGNAVRIGETSPGNIRRSFPLFFNDEHSHLSEQYAFAWTTFEIYRDIHPRYHDTPASIAAISSYRFPPINGIAFETVIRKAWNLQYSSMADLQKEVKIIHDNQLSLVNRISFAASEVTAQLSNRRKEKRQAKVCQKAYAQLCREELEMVAATQGNVFPPDLFFPR